MMSKQKNMIKQSAYWLPTQKNTCGNKYCEAFAREMMLLSDTQKWLLHF